MPIGFNVKYPLCSYFRCYCSYFRCRTAG